MTDVETLMSARDALQAELTTLLAEDLHGPDVFRPPRKAAIVALKAEILRTLARVARADRAASVVP